MGLCVCARVCVCVRGGGRETLCVWICVTVCVCGGGGGGLCVFPLPSREGQVVGGRG